MTKQKWICLNILLIKGHTGSVSIKDYVKFMDFRFCCLFWQSLWLNYSTKQVFQDRNQASEQLELSCNTWCDSSHSYPTLSLIPREFQRRLCKVFSVGYRELPYTWVFIQSKLPWMTPCAAKAQKQQNQLLNFLILKQTFWCWSASREGQQN